MLFHDLLLFEQPGVVAGGGAPPVPGTEATVPGTPDPTSAATQTTETQEQPPGPVPYARFKEVNDARRDLDQRIQPFVEIESYGYGADDLHRLVSWEQEYLQDPAGTWLRQADTIADLPAEVKAAIEQVSTSTQGKSSTTDGGPPQAGSTVEEVDDNPPAWAQPLLQERAERQAAAEQTAISGLYDGLVTAWNQIDESQGIRTPDEMKHAFIAAASVNAGSAEELLRNARETYLASREQLLGDVVQVPGRRPGETVPRPVPGSGPSAPGTPPPQPRTLREATRMAEADANAGLLQPLNK